MNSPTFYYLPVASTLDDQARTQELTSKYDKALSQIGGTQIQDLTTFDHPLCFFLIVTGGTEHRVLELLEIQSLSEAKIGIIALSSQNSLAAALELTARLHQDGKQGQVFYLEGPDDPEGLRAIKEAVEMEESARELSKSRVGMIGEPSDWLVASQGDPAVVRRTWGPEVISYDFSAVEKFAKKLSEKEIDKVAHTLSTGARTIVEPSEADIYSSSKLALALKEFVVAESLDALTIRCFDLLKDLKTTGCFALAKLNEEGTIAGCEGDLSSTIAMLWASKVLGQTPWMANPAQIDRTTNSLWLAHCTIPRNLLSSYSLRSHFESGIGVAIQGEIISSVVTLFRIGGKNLDQLWIKEGKIEHIGASENLCRTQISIRLQQGNVGTLLEQPLGGHLIMVFGHHMKRLETSWRTIFGNEYRLSEMSC